MEPPLKLLEMDEVMKYHLFQSGTLNQLWSQLNPSINPAKSCPTLFGKILKIFKTYEIETTFLFSMQVNDLWETKGCNNTIYVSSNYVHLHFIWGLMIAFLLCHI